MCDIGQPCVCQQQLTVLAPGKDTILRTHGNVTSNYGVLSRCQNSQLLLAYTRLVLQCCLSLDRLVLTQVIGLETSRNRLW